MSYSVSKPINSDIIARQVYQVKKQVFTGHEYLGPEYTCSTPTSTLRLSDPTTPDEKVKQSRRLCAVDSTNFAHGLFLERAV